jgi:hypothetical protein
LPVAATTARRVSTGGGGGHPLVELVRAIIYKL